MGNSLNVLVGAPGTVSFAPTGTTLPTDPSSGLNGSFVDLGLVSFDGVVEGHGQQTANIKEWSGQTVRTLLTEQTDSLKATFLETNPDVLEVYHGPQTDPTSVIEVTKQSGQRGCWVMDILDGSNKMRVVVPDGQVTANEDISYKADDAVAYGVTITCYPDTSGNTMYKYPLDAAIS